MATKQTTTAEPMSLKRFRSLSKCDFDNGAVRDEIDAALNEREWLLRMCYELDIEMDGVRCPASAAAILNGLRAKINERS